MAEIRNTVILLLIQFLSMTGGSVGQKFSNFTCDNGVEINFVEVCDGELNCEDGSDETGCDNDAILFYYTSNRGIPHLSLECQRYEDPNQYGNGEYNFNHYGHCNDENYYGFRELSITGIYLNDNKEFSIAVLYERVRGYFRIPWETELPSLKNVHISSNGPQLDVFYRSRDRTSDVDFIKRITRAGVEENTLNIGNNDIKSLVVDWVTTYIYYISNSTIKVCEKNCAICVALPSKFVSDPVLLTISPKHRLLFWIEKISTYQFYLYKYAIDMSSKITPICQDLKAPVWLTVDAIQEKVYWMDYGYSQDVSPSIYSITFKGADVEAISGTSKPISSFAVFDSTLYWSEKNKPEIWKCSASECKEPTLFKQVDNLATINHGKDFEMGSLIMDHRSSPSIKIQNACTNSSCSHLCLLDPETLFNCYCEGSDKPLSSNISNGYCEDTTLIAAYQNHLYVVGLFSNSELAPIVRRNTIKVNSISTITYNSIKGNVILTETEQQKLYSWIPRTGDLTLLSDDGSGSIKSVEFDNHANNLYWIDPVKFAIKVMNLDTLIKVTILEGNSTYLPTELTLAPAKGYMFVQFLKNNSTIVFERISMDGRRVRPPIHVDKEIEDIGSLHLHYLRDTDTLYLLDRQRNKIRYFLNEKSGFRDMTYSSTVGEVDRITSLNNFIVWSEDNLIIRRGRLETSQIVIKQKILLGLQKNGSDVLKVAPIVKSTVQSRLAKCLRNNGGCQELCLVTEKSPKFTCVCTGNRTLINGNSCKNNVSEIIVTDYTTKENSVVIRNNTSEIDHNTDRTLTTQVEDVMHRNNDEQKTKSTCIKSCPILRCPPCECTTNESSSNRNFQIVKRKHESETNFVGSYPVPETSVERSSSYHILNLIIISILALSLGFTLGYLFQRSRSEHGSLKSCQENGTLELSRMRGESIMTLCSKNDESVNNELKN